MTVEEAAKFSDKSGSQQRSDSMNKPPPFSIIYRRTTEAKRNDVKRRDMLQTVVKKPAETKEAKAESPKALAESIERAMKEQPKLFKTIPEDLSTPFFPKGEPKTLQMDQDPTHFSLKQAFSTDQSRNNQQPNSTLMQ